MNPHDATKQPGAHLVAEMLGDEDPWTLNIAYRPGDPLYRASTLVIGAAHELDELHGRVTRATQAALGVLEPVGRGEFNGSPSSYTPLRSTVAQIGRLVSAQNAAYERLTQSIFAYRRLLPEPDAASPADAAARDLDNGQVSGRDDDWAVSADLRLRALEAVEAGGLRFHQSGVYGYISLSDERGERPSDRVWPETVQRLVADGLLDRDTSEGLYRPGQLLSLTPKGEAALRDARTATPRVSAALNRSSTTTLPVAAADPSVVRATDAATKPSRSR
ncbi:large ATP-binding protein [Streptomyces sp. NBC_01261]|uniref:large ATP-binding protein n=1 Tax=Streptomyces sp. NBC_01261 TaxID=2903802 RepID=UPI002E32A353|nr:large ATP-binding protein [Streptomyces sp. NBC_01261]